MVILHNKEIFFSNIVNGSIHFKLKLKDLIINDCFYIPINNTFYNFINKEFKEINENRLSTDSVSLYLKINKEQKVFIGIKDKLDLYEIEIPNTASYIIDDFTLASENIFFNNIDKYEENNYSLKDIVTDIYKKTPYQNRDTNYYISSLENISNQDLDKINRFIPSKIKVKILNLNDLEIM